MECGSRKFNKDFWDASALGHQFGNVDTTVKRLGDKKKMSLIVVEEDGRPKSLMGILQSP